MWITPFKKKIKPAELTQVKKPFKCNWFLFAFIITFFSSGASWAFTRDYRRYLEAGGMWGQVNRDTQASGLVGFNAIAIQRNIRNSEKIFQQYYYGRYDVQMDLGNGLGIYGHGFPWRTFNAGIVAHQTRNGLFPHLGIELLNFQYAANTNSLRKDFFEYQPALSAGCRFLATNFAWLFLARAGASVGTLGEGGGRWFASLQSFFVYRAYNVSLELSRIIDRSAIADMADADISYQATQDIALGIRGMGLVLRENTGIDSASRFNWLSATDYHTEYRISFVLRFTPIERLAIYEEE